MNVEPLGNSSGQMAEGIRREIVNCGPVVTALVTQGAEAAPGTPEEFAAFIQSETVKLKEVIDRTGMRVD